MTIGSYTKDDFGRKLGEVVSAAHPVRSIEMLKGRDQQLEEIERALYQTGRHIFIYGDRGVGKSSLAATAATQYQSADASPIYVSGSPDETFNSIVANIGTKALDRSKTDATRRRSSLSMEFRGLRWQSSEEISALDIAAQIKTVGDAAELLRQVAYKHSDRPSVVLDEFDAIPDPAERARFAALLKQLGDQSSGIKFFITGVGQSCDELLGAHQSAHRQLATFELQRLGWNPRREIVDQAAGAFGLNVDYDVNWRIALISDGFPYYIHLIMEKMLWEGFSDERQCETLSWEHFYSGLRVAIAETNAELRRPYERAVLQRPPEYEDVVWSTADGDDLIRPLSAMRYSYERIVEKRGDRPRVEPTKYNEIVRRLKTASYGAVLQQLPNRPGWYTYTEKMLRGYVRMQAEAEHVQLSGERPSPKPRMHVPNSRTGYYGSSVPRGVNINRIENIGDKDSDDDDVDAR